MRTLVEVKAVLDHVEPEKWGAALQTFFTEAYEQVEKLTADNTKLRADLDEAKTKLDKVTKGAFMLAREVKLMREGRGAAPAGNGHAATEAEAPTEAAAPMSTEGVSPVRVDGTPRTPEEMEVEAQMNAAIAATEADVRAGKAPPAPGRS